MLYKNLDDDYIDNEDDIFNFSRINQRNNNNEGPTTPHFQKLNKEINNYVKRQTPSKQDIDLSINDPTYTYSIFTTPLAKQTAEKFGMTVTESKNRKRRYSASSLYAHKANLFVTPKKTQERMNVLMDGSKTVSYIRYNNNNYSNNTRLIMK
ncbi:hypothetical protein BCR32DRAFT_136130 [Anaeromyces robustus]|uniref:Uncharacterized protein n=1 Tax=Anaeromyces robustus TaxID=1754192 RepID=A0A1Y1VRP3_9FUNG|nr:hypothetical protein BCR32DRAFT_136130 [Anaeromyces robustus]|eukprot:ORX63715.1 hypothetical protein BCR32DRAFT_136130 [Anaeromyces robustus]